MGQRARSGFRGPRGPKGDAGASSADSVSVDASGFIGNLSPTDTDVQEALKTVDELSIGDIVGSNILIDFGQRVEASSTLTYGSRV